MQGKKELNVLQLAVIVSSVLMVVIGFGFIIGGVFSNTKYDEKVVENASTIKELEKTIEDMETSKIEKEDALAKYNNSASDEGIAVAVMQSGYSSLDATTQAESILDNGAKGKAYFKDSDVNFIKPWFTPSKSQMDYVWTFCTTFSFNADKTDVIWLCTNTGKDAMLAYATGVFDVESRTFSEIKVHALPKGIEYTDSEKLQEIQKQIDVIFADGGDENDN